MRLSQLSIESTIARKTKRAALADERLQNIADSTTMKLLPAYILSVDAAFAKLKPADKKIADARLAEALADKRLKPQDLTVTYTIWSKLSELKFEYRGQKSHGTKLLAQIQRLLPTDGTEEEFELLVDVLFATNSLKVAKLLLGKLRRHFRLNPAFAFVEAKVLLSEKKMNFRQLDQARRLLNLARELIHTSKNPAHQLLLDPVEEAMRSIPGFRNPFELLFGGR